MRRTALLIPLAFALAGCGYTTRGLYPTEDIRTISIAYFKTTGFRRDFEFLLKERIIQRIEAKTPFKVVDEGSADTILTGTISSAKLPFGDDGYDNPRGGFLNVQVDVLWTDRRTGQVINRNRGTFPLRAQESWIIDLGQSKSTAEHDAANRLADHIVSLIQAPW